MAYERVIREALARLGDTETPVAVVEAVARLEHGTLDALTFERFVALAGAARALWIEDQATGRALAESYGLEV